MCEFSYDQGSDRGRLRRKAGGLAASSAALAATGPLAFTHSHPIFGGILIAVQASLLTVAIVLLVRAKRATRS